MQTEEQDGRPADRSATCNIYGFTDEEWAGLDRRRKCLAYHKLCQARLRAANPEKWAEQSRAKDYRRRHRDIEAARRRDRERYQRRRSVAQVRHSPEDTYKLVTKAIPGGLPRHDRDDLAGAMCLAILEGKLLVKNIKAEVAKYLKAHNREYDTFKTLSLDATVPGTKKTYVDNIASDAVHF